MPTGHTAASPASRVMSPPIVAPQHRSILHPNLCLWMPLSVNLRDYISGQYLTLNRSGELVYLGKDGLYHTAPADHPAIGKYGVFHDGAGTNLVEYSEDMEPWKYSDSQFTLDDVKYWGDVKLTRYNVQGHWGTNPGNKKYSITSGKSYTLSLFVEKLNTGTEPRIDLDGDNIGRPLDIDSLINDLEVGEKARVQATFTADTDDDARILLQNDDSDLYIGGFQLEESPYASYIPTNGSSASRATQASDASDNGLSIALSNLNSRLETALASEGAAILQLRPEFDYGVNTSDAGLISFNDSADDFLFYNNGVLKFTDGTNTATFTQEWSKGDRFWPVVKWGGGELVVGVYDGSSISWGTTQSFEGSFPKNTDLRPFFGNELPQFAGGLKFFDKAPSDDVLVREASK